MRRRLGAALAGVLVLAAVVGGGVAYGRHAYLAPGPAGQPRNLVVPRGGLEAVGEALAQAGLIRDPLAFRIAATLTRSAGPVHAAELAFPAQASLRQVLVVLRTAKPVQHHLTIPEGLTAAQIAEIVAHAEAATGDTPVPAEGAVLPQTYAYEYGTPRAALMERAEAAMTQALDKLWAGRDPAVALASPQQAVILASIVERETAVPDERAHVAAVFLNRLRLGMKLQSDPTVIYGASGGLGVLDRPLSRADLDRDGPYNTYRIPGLPPGPISAPGLASLQAVLRPDASSDLYFVADGSGGHAFARTLAAHDQNVQQWRSRTAAGRK